MDKKMALTSITSKQRKLSSELSPKQQIANLKALIKNPPENSRVCEFTPELAEYILSNLNIKNRPRKAQKIIEYKRDMQNNNWSLTGETIKFGTDGLLKDGQNRLAACLQAQVPFTTHAIYGIDPNTFHHMDTGKNRGADDVLAIMGVTNSNKIAQTIKFLINWERGKTNTAGAANNDMIKRAYLNKYNPDLLQEGVSWARKVYTQTRYPIGPIAATFYSVVDSGYRNDIEKFFAAMMAGTGKANSGPVKLMKHITFMRMNRMHISSHDYSVLLSRAVHCFVNNKSMTKADLNVNLADKRMPLPSAK